MSDDASRWKEKYLNSLEQQEQLDRRWSTRFDLLRRGLVRSSLAAEGTDKSVDRSMQELREILRRDDLDSGLNALIPRLEKAVLDSEQRRQQRANETLAALQQLVDQVRGLDPPRDVRVALKALRRQMEEAAAHTSRLPALLSQLSNLLGQTLLHLRAEQPQSPGLLQRLFGSAADTAAGPAPALAAPQALALAPAVSPAEPHRDETVAFREPVLRPATALMRTLDSLPVPPGLLPEAGAEQYALPATEPGYSTVAPHIAESLRNLLNELELPPRHQPQGAELLQRVQGPLNWYELVPVLNDLGVLVLAVSDSGQREFAGYLRSLNERLAAFIGPLNEAHEGYSASRASARSFSEELREQVSDLQSSVQAAADLDSLKQALELRLDGLLESVQAHQRQHDGREQEVAERLQGLMQRVAEMELESQQFRQHLEEQRQKSLLDPLTGLPNRAAWSERLELETARRERYGGELLLAVLDVDHFKRINDGYGHLAGDRVLKIIAGELHKRLRKTDFIARFGGEEFVVLIPATPLEGGLRLLETLRAAIEACPFHFKGEPVTITLSGGLAAFGDDDSGDTVFERADQALYRAKHGGRNRIEQG